VLNVSGGDSTVFALAGIAIEVVRLAAKKSAADAIEILPAVFRVEPLSVKIMGDSEFKR
jgi:hypothetical protein